MLRTLTDALTAAATLTLRFLAILFVRYHPLGPRYLPRIYFSFGLSLAGILAQLVLSRKRLIRYRRRRSVAPLLGWLDTARPVSTAVGVAVNFLCMIACLDSVYRAHFIHQSHDLAFSRVGYVDDTTARVVVRAPWGIEDVSIVAIDVTRANDGGSSGVQTLKIHREDDFVGTFLLRDLAPSTDYSYSIRDATDKKGQTNKPSAALAGSFRTLPPRDQHPRRWSLVSTSCIKPFYPYNPLSHGLAIPGLDLLSSYPSALSSSRPGDNETAMTPEPDLMLFLGDFIYIDLPMPVGWDWAAYTTAYRQVYASPSWDARLRSMQWVHAYDDHEIKNDWAANETGLYGNAMAPFHAYQGRANPPPAAPGDTYYIFRRGDISFFVLDTRRYRSGLEVPDGPDKTMLGAWQLGDLRDWLVGREDDAWKVVFSSVPFTRNWRGPDQGDSWSGYLRERDLVLDTMRQNGGAVILSGDRHEHATTVFPASREGETRVIEFSTSPLNQFYEPFDRQHRQIEDTDISIHSHPWGNSSLASSRSTLPKSGGC